jgi:membrane-bound lytic murein transglycosylase D
MPGLIKRHAGPVCSLKGGIVRETPPDVKRLLHRAMSSTRLWRENWYIAQPLRLAVCRVDVSRNDTTSQRPCARRPLPLRRVDAMKRETRSGRHARDLRLAVFGGCCTALGGACLLLAACAGNMTREEPVAALPPAPIAALEPPPPPAAMTTAPPAQIESPWPRLRASFELPGCNYNASVQRWTRAFAQNPRALANSLSASMPYLLHVADQLNRHRLPGEFAFLPYLESNYTPIATTGDRAAGIWQLMPDTAVEAGLRIAPDYDGRLDIHASTLAAISLLRQYHDEFGDWRLADMAFNAGLYKVRGLLGSRAHDDWTAPQLGRLGVNAETHDHLAKLLALACIVSDPARFRVRLPEPDSDDVLALLELPAPVDLELAARLAGIDVQRLRQLNPGFVRGRMPEQGPHRLLVPAARRTAVTQTLDKLPRYVWRNWHAVVLKRSETLDLFAMLGDIDPGALAAVNGHAPDEPLAPGTRLLLPGHAEDTDTAIADPAPLADDARANPPESLVVHAGDTLWVIARRYGLHVDDLLRWNGLTRNATLRLGQRLLLNQPATSAAATPSAAPQALAD